jgi:hypothetical protein
MCYPKVDYGRVAHRLVEVCLLSFLSHYTPEKAYLYFSAHKIFSKKEIAHIDTHGGIEAHPKQSPVSWLGEPFGE